MSENPCRSAPAPRPGTLYGIGVGPGDPELLTLKAARLLRTLPCLYAPVGSGGGPSYAARIVAEHLAPGRVVCELEFAMRGAPAEQAARWRANAETVAADLRSGCDVGFLTEGDPLLYSTFVHLAGAIDAVCPEAPVVAVPGVSSFLAAAAAAGVPLADGDQRVAILPATYRAAEIRAALASFDTVILLKVASAVDRVVDLLEELGRIDHAVLVTRCGRPEQRIVRDLRSLRGQKLDYFSLAIIRSEGR